MGRKYDLLLSQHKQLYTNRLKLRQFSMEDRKDIFEFSSDEESTKYVKLQENKSLDQVAFSCMLISHGLDYSYGHFLFTKKKYEHFFI